ncbi:MAG: hypothetical protein AAGF12_04860 [Myxococcota bacterium]
MHRYFTLGALALVGSCGEPEPEDPRPETTPAEPAAAPVEPREASCEERGIQHATPIIAVQQAHLACDFDHECVTFEAVDCVEDCPIAVHARGYAPLLAAVEDVRDACSALQAECPPAPVECPAVAAVCDGDRCVARDEAMLVDRESAEVEVPAGNRARLEDAPPRPPLGRAGERARRLFLAIQRNEPRIAADFYFPREAFLEVKGIEDPGGYWDRLWRRYEADIRELHESLPDLEEAEFERFDLVRRGGWVEVREEGNRLPYWVSRHSFIYYKVGEEERRLEVRVLITWGNEWYITHLNEFR